MTILTQGPDALRHVYEWTTDILISRNGNEQRVALRQVPRQSFFPTYLADSDELIQYWKFALLNDLENVWNFPLWHESEKITAPVTALDTTVDADFTLMDDSLGPTMVILHPDGVTNQILPISGRTDTTATMSSGSVNEDYPLGSVIIPIEGMFIKNNSGYAALANNAANLQLDFVANTNRDVEAKGAAALLTFKGLPVLDRRSDQVGAPDVFSEKLQRIDHGHKIQIDTDQEFANITGGRRYTGLTKAERQFWKLFLITIIGQQKPFYSSTFRPDMTIETQPAVGGTSFIVFDDAPVAGGWENIESHLELAVETADGTTQFVTIDPVLTIDNGDGTHTVEFTPALTATVDGSNVLRVSFLELVRLASDRVQVDYFDVAHQVVTLATRTIAA